jgi:hypothetical protein
MIPFQSFTWDEHKTLSIPRPQIGHVRPTNGPKKPYITNTGQLANKTSANLLSLKKIAA